MRRTQALAVYDLDEWIDFVCDCRDGKRIYEKYDVIFGKVANDKVFLMRSQWKYIIEAGFLKRLRRGERESGI